MPKSGVCRFCKCTQRRACRIEDILGDVTSCCWVDRKRTVCSNPKCVQKYMAEKNK
jgi:hypothetical protein